MAMNKQRKTSDLVNVVVTDASNNVTLPNNLTINALISAGLIKADGTGKLVAATAGTDYVTGNIYTADGTLTGNRTVTMGTYTLSFEKDVTINGITIGLGLGQQSFNMAVGNGALKFNTTGNFNTAIGMSALQANRTGGANLAVGQSALSSHQSGYYNCAVGVDSLLNITSGNNNVSLGVRSGRFISGGTTNLTIADNSIFIGYNTQALADSQTNQIVIGYGAVGLGSNTMMLGNSSITTTAIYGNTIIGGTTDAGYKLDVQGTGRFTGNVLVNKLNLQADGKIWYNNVWGERWAINMAGDGNLSFTSTKGSQYINFVGESTYTYISASTNVSSSIFIGKFEGREGYITATQNANTGSYTASTARISAGYTSGLTQSATNTNGVTLYISPANGGGSGTRADIIFQTVDSATYAPNDTHQFLDRWFIKGSSGTLTNISSPNGSAIFQVDSTTKGFLKPRMTGAQIEAISTPAEGLEAYATSAGSGSVTSAGWWGYDGSTWTKINGGGSGTNIYNANGTLSGNRTVTSGGYNLTFTGTNTASAALATGIKMNHTLVAAANNDVLVGLDINPTFTVGAFTGVTKYAIRTTADVKFGTVYINSGNTYTTVNTSSTASNWNQFVSTDGTGEYGIWNDSLYFQPLSTLANGFRLYTSSNNVAFNMAQTGDLVFGNSQSKFYYSTGNWILGGTTDAGYKLDVQGTGRFTGAVLGADGSAFNNVIFDGAGTKRIRPNNNTLDITDSSGTIGFQVGGTYPRVSQGYNRVTLVRDLLSFEHVQATNQTMTLSLSGSYVGHLDPYVDIVAAGYAATATNKNTTLRLYTTNTTSGVYGNIIISHDGTNKTGNVLIGGSTNNASAIVNIQSTTQGFLPPRMTSAQRTAISSPAVGLIVYQTDGTEGTYENTSGGWRIINAAGGGGSGTVTSVDMSVPTGFSIGGNPITTSGTLALTFASGYSLPTTVKQTNWDDAYTWVGNFPSQTSNGGKFLKTDGSTLSWDNPLNIYNSNGTLSGNRTVTMSGNTLYFDGGNIGMGAAASSNYRLNVQDSISDIISGGTTYSYKSYAPTSNKTNINSYNGVFSTYYNLTSGAYLGDASYNATSLLNQVAVAGNAGTQSTQPLRAAQFVLVGSFGAAAMNISDFRFFDIKTPDYASVSGHVVSTIYGLKIGTLKGASGFTITNGWGVYQEGSSDNNYFAGKLLVGSSSDAGAYNLQLTGQMRLNSYTSGTSYTGTSAGLLGFDSSGNVISISTSYYLTTNNPAYTGVLTTGTLGYSATNHMASLQSSVNSYNQFVIQNTNPGASASSDVVVNNDLSTDSTYYGDFGINSSGFSGTGSFGLPNATYLAAANGDIVIGTYTSNAIRFVINSGATDSAVIKTTGQLQLNGYTTTTSFTGTTVGYLAFDASGNIITVASPSAGAGGSNTQIQYNNSGALAGASNVEIVSGNLAIVDSTFPSAPSAGRNILFTDAMGGRQMMSAMATDGNHYDFQPSLFGTTTVMWLPSTGTTLAINWSGSYTARNSGTAAAQNSSITPTSTNAVTSMIRAQFGTGSTATGASGVQTSLPVAWLGNAANLGGFFFFARFALEATSGTYRIFVGLSANNAALAADPSTLANSVGISLDAADTTFQFLTRSATTATKTNSTVTPSTTTVYDFYMYALPNATAVNFELRNAATNAVLATSNNVTTNLPTNTTFMYMQCHISSATGTTSKVLSMNKMYLETNM